MEIKTIFTTLVAAFALANSLLAGTFSSSTTAPTVQSTDIANLATQTGSDKWFFQTADEADPSDAAKGQTFTTGSAAAQLKALTYKISAGNLKAAPTTYTVRVGTVSGTAFTFVDSETFSQTVNTATGAYMTWTLATPRTLAPNTTYGIDVAMNSGVSYTTGIPYLSYSANVSNARIATNYDSGDAGVSNATLVLTKARDRVFHLDMEDPMRPSPVDGSTVPAGNVALSWTNLPATTGTNVWVGVWFGTNPAALTKVVSVGLNTMAQTVSAPTGAAQWPSYNLSDPEGDFDLDGASNDDERVWGLNPTSGVSFSPIKSTASLKSGTFTYTRRPPSLSGRTYTVWTSPNLTTWARDAGAIQTPAAPVGGMETVAVTLSPALLSNPKLFIRLEAAP